MRPPAGGRPQNAGVPDRRRVFRAEGIFNLRELGGYPAGENGRKQVARGILYRSGDLSAMTGNDRIFLERRGIVTVVDFRADDERISAPDAKIGTVRKRLDLPIDAGNLMDMAYTAVGAEAEMKKLYRALPGEAIPRYRILFELLSDPANTPLLFHCTAGKDRTGLAAALILYALGADMDTIFTDYLVSAAEFRKRYASVTKSQPAMVPYMSVRRDYLETALACIDSRYGGLDRYIRNELRADAAHLRSLYTRPAREPAGLPNKPAE